MIAVLGMVLVSIVAAPQAFADGVLDAGNQHSCAVKPDGAPVCWGNSEYGQAASGVPAGITVRSISAGNWHTCAVKTDGAPVCWGDDWAGQVSGVPAGITVRSISAGRWHTCAVKTDGSPVCWGDDDSGQAASGVPAGITVRSISAGGFHSCAVKTDGFPVCWGYDDYGQAASGVPAGITVSSISAGFYHSCAVKTDGSPVCWGYDDYGQAASGVPAGITVSSISAGFWDTCAVKTDGTPVCWGYDLGQAASGVPAGITVSSISAGGSDYNVSHACAVKTDGTPVCWGNSDYGQTDIPAGLGTIGAPASDAPPTISAAEWMAGETVSADRGTWDRVTAGYAYGWRRCSGTSEDTCTRIDGADAATYTLRDADDGFRIRYAVTAANVTGETTELSAASPVVARPVPTTVPALSGSTRTGDTLTLSPGEWTGTPTGYGTAWLRCDDTTVESCAVIDSGDATDGNMTYTLVDADDAKRIRARIVAENGEGTSRPFTTQPTAVIDIPTLVTAPSISGTTKTGDTLTADPGEWTNNPTSHDVEWLRCTDLSVDSCSVIADATSPTYTLVDADDAKRIRVRVAGRNAGGAGAPATSAPTAVVDLPTNTMAPSISGTTKTGDTLTADPGEWTGDPTSHDVEWLRCTDSLVDSCSVIADAASPTYTLVDADDAKRIRVRVAGRNAGGAGAPSTSEATAVVDLPTSTKAPSISGTTKTGDTLTANPGEWTGDPTSHDAEWLRCTNLYLSSCTVIAGATGLTYQLVDADDAKRIRVRVAGRNAGGAGAPVTSAPTAVVDLPTNTKAPSISGTTKAGDVLTADVGEWTGDPTSYAIEWLRCTGTSTTSCVKITTADATDNDTGYTLIDADNARRIRTRVTARNAGGAGAPATSTYTAVVDVPTLLAAPAVTGLTRTGDVLTTTRGDWTGSPTGYTVEWLRCTSAFLASCTKIATTDATDNTTTYKLVDADDAARIRSRVTARNAGGPGPASTSQATGIVDIPTVKTVPTITGTTKTGDTLTANPGTWTGDPTGYTVEWLRCSSADAADCVKILATDATNGDLIYKLVDADDAKRIRVRVAGRNASGTGTASTSAATAIVDVPTLLTAPSLTGTTRTGDTLTVNTGGWTGNPTAYAIEWLRCTTIYLAHCTAITGTDATDQNKTYQLTDADDGARIRARVTPSNASGSGPASTSLYTVIVDLPTASKAPSVSGSTKTGDTLTLDRGEWTGAPTSYTIEWLRCTGTDTASCTKMTSTDATNGDLTYKLVDADDAKRIRGRVTGKNAHGTGTAATTAATAVIDLPTLLAAPVVTGTAQVGQVLTTTRGDWTGAPTGHTIEWLRCTTIYLANCTAITTDDATDNDLTYTPVAADQGARIRSRVTARNAGGDGPKTPSLYTKVVAAP